MATSGQAQATDNLQEDALVGSTSLTVGNDDVINDFINSDAGKQVCVLKGDDAICADHAKRLHREKKMDCVDAVNQVKSECKKHGYECESPDDMPPVEKA